MLHATIDGQPYDVPEGRTILEALRGVGADVPTLCHDERLKPLGGCRLCLVRVAARDAAADILRKCASDGDPRD